jgi:hypothetical protein
MGKQEPRRSTQATDLNAPHSPSPIRPALTAEEQEEQGLTVLPPIVWTAGIAGMVAVLLLSS